MDYKYAIVGFPLGHTLSPIIHDFIFEKIGIVGKYGKLEFDNKKIDNLIPYLIENDFIGVNVTMPYKEVLIDKLDYISDEAKKIGVINTIKIKDGKSYGYNTDYFGFENMLKRKNVDLKDKNITIIGNGGTAKTVITLGENHEVSNIDIVSRNMDNLKELKENFPNINIYTYEDQDKISGDILINTTPLGMEPNENISPVDSSIIKNHSICVDVIYNPLKTKFLQIGASENKIIINGLYMLIDQAIKTQEILQDMKIDYEIGNELYNILKKDFE